MPGRSPGQGRTGPASGECGAIFTRPRPTLSVRVRRGSPARIAMPHPGREHHHPHHRNAMDISGQAPYSRGRSPVVRWRGGMYGTEGMTRCRRPHRTGLPELVWCRCDTDLSAADMRPAALFSSPLGYADQKPLSRMATAITRRHRLAAKLSAGASICTMPRRASVWRGMTRCTCSTWP